MCHANPGKAFFPPPVQTRSLLHLMGLWYGRDSFLLQERQLLGSLSRFFCRVGVYIPTQALFGYFTQGAVVETCLRSVAAAPMKAPLGACFIAGWLVVCFLEAMRFPWSRCYCCPQAPILLEQKLMCHGAAGHMASLSLHLVETGPQLWQLPCHMFGSKKLQLTNPKHLGQTLCTQATLQRPALQK